MFFHVGKCALGGYHGGVWESLQEGREAEEMVSMPVSDVDVGQTLVWKEILDPVGQRVGLGFGEEGVDKHGFMSTGYEGGGCGRP